MEINLNTERIVTSSFLSTYKVLSCLNACQNHLDKTLKCYVAISRPYIDPRFNKCLNHFRHTTNTYIFPNKSDSLECVAGKTSLHYYKASLQFVNSLCQNAIDPHELLPTCLNPLITNGFLFSFSFHFKSSLYIFLFNIAHSLLPLLYQPKKKIKRKSTLFSNFL